MVKESESHVVLSGEWGWFSYDGEVYYGDNIYIYGPAVHYVNGGSYAYELHLRGTTKDNYQKILVIMVEADTDDSHNQFFDELGFWGNSVEMMEIGEEKEITQPLNLQAEFGEGNTQWIEYTGKDFSGDCMDIDYLVSATTLFISPHQSYAFGQQAYPEFPHRDVTFETQPYQNWEPIPEPKPDEPKPTPTPTPEPIKPTEPVKPPTPTPEPEPYVPKKDPNAPYKPWWEEYAPPAPEPSTPTPTRRPTPPPASKPDAVIPTEVVKPIPLMSPEEEQKKIEEEKKANEELKKKVEEADKQKQKEQEEKEKLAEELKNKFLEDELKNDMLRKSKFPTSETPVQYKPIPEPTGKETPLRSSPQPTPDSVKPTDPIKPATPTKPEEKPVPSTPTYQTPTYQTPTYQTPTPIQPQSSTPTTPSDAPIYDKPDPVLLNQVKRRVEAEEEKKKQEEEERQKIEAELLQKFMEDDKRNDEVRKNLYPMPPPNSTTLPPQTQSPTATPTPDAIRPTDPSRPVQYQYPTYDSPNPIEVPIIVAAPEGKPLLAPNAPVYEPKVDYTQMQKNNDNQHKQTVKQMDEKEALKVKLMNEFEEDDTNRQTQRKTRYPQYFIPYYFYPIYDKAIDPQGEFPALTPNGEPYPKKIDPSDPASPYNTANPNSPYNPENPNSPFNPKSANNPNNPHSPFNPSNPNSPFNPKNPSYDPNSEDLPDKPNSPFNPNNPKSIFHKDHPLNPNNPKSPFNPKNKNDPNFVNPYLKKDELKQGGTTPNATKVDDKEQAMKEAEKAADLAKKKQICIEGKPCPKIELGKMKYCQEWKIEPILNRHYTNKQSWGAEAAGGDQSCARWGETPVYAEQIWTKDGQIPADLNVPKYNIITPDANGNYPTDAGAGSPPADGSSPMSKWWWIIIPILAIAAAVGIAFWLLKKKKVEDEAAGGLVTA